MPTSHKIFGQNVKAHRKRIGLSQEALGFAADLHPTEISHLERATRDPRLGTIVKVAKALGVTPSQLVEGI